MLGSTILHDAVLAHIMHCTLFWKLADREF